MAKSYRIKVTQEDIDNGEQGSPDTCPIAIAMGRELPEAQSIKVGIAVASFRLPTKNTLTFVPLPLVAKQFIDRFDVFHVEPIEPVEFTIEVPDA